MQGSSRVFLSLGALCAGLAVALGAYFAHAPAFAGGIPATVQTALTQQHVHAMGLLVVGLALDRYPASRWWLAAGWLMVVGMLLFSFNLHARALWQWDTLRAFVPWGGTAWMLAWLCLALGAWRRPAPRHTA